MSVQQPQKKKQADKVLRESNFVEQKSIGFSIKINILFPFILFQFTNSILDLMQSENSIPQILTQMLRQVNSSQSFRKFIKKIAQRMNFDKNNILNLTQDKVETLYVTLKTKIQNIHYNDQFTRNLESSVWLQNQLRIFIYILCSHLFLKKIAINELKQQDYLFLQKFFPNKRSSHLEYQVKLLLNTKNPKWSLEECKLFNEIMSENKDSKRWNYIAKELFIRSNKKFFKTPKQCRERWINHQDPSKLRGGWEKSQDLVLLTSVINFGKKWTLIVRQLNDTRTQNNVKNRYNSLIKMAKKKYRSDKNQQSLVNMLLQERESVQKIQNLDKIFFQSQQKKLAQNEANYENQQPINTQTVQQIKEQLSPKKSQTIKRQIKVCPTRSSQNDFKYIFDESQQLQNIEWNHSQSNSTFNEKFYLTDGKLCFDKFGSI